MDDSVFDVNLRRCWYTNKRRHLKDNVARMELLAYFPARTTEGYIVDCCSVEHEAYLQSGVNRH